MEENVCELCLDAPLCDEENIPDNADATEMPLPTRKDYEDLVVGVFKSFYDEDMDGVRESARAEAKRIFDEQRESIIKEAQRELISKIRAKNQRVSEIGAMRGHGNARKNVSDMTKEERAAVAKRAACGEIINLK